MKNLQKGFAVPIIIAVISLLAIGGGVYIYTNNKVVEAPVSIPDIISNVPPATTTDSNIDKVPTPIKVTPTEPVFCTMDAFQCPDGSWVGRTGPKCEFVCPQVKDNKIDLINNICTVNDDCKYISQTGGCNIPEYVAQRQKEAEAQGLFIGEASPLIGEVTCTCENNKCITNN